MNNAGTDRPSPIYQTYGYSQIDVFFERIDEHKTPEIIVSDDKHRTAAIITMDPDAYRQHSSVNLDSNVFCLRAENAKVTYAYLTGGPDLLGRGIRILDTAGLENSEKKSGNADLHTVGHLEPPLHWMNDPNGLCRFQGRYHVYYQFNPYGSGWGNPYWAHAVSKDMVHWKQLPVILEPQKELESNRNLAGGAFSGSAVTVDSEGKPCRGDDASAIRFYFTRHLECIGEEGSVVEYQATCLSYDSISAGSETCLVKRPNARFGLDFRDPKVETNVEGHRAVMVIATNLPISDVPRPPLPGTIAEPDGGSFSTQAHVVEGDAQPNMLSVPVIAAFANDSDTLDNDAWEYSGVMLADFGRGESRTYECPDAFMLEGSSVVLGALMHYRTLEGAFQPVRWYIGNFDDTCMVVTSSGWCDFGTCYYATQSFLDDSGRRIVIGWLADWFGVRSETGRERNGVMSFPRELHVKGGKLYAKPVREIYDYLVSDLLAVSRNPGIIRTPCNAYYADIHYPVRENVRDENQTSIVLACVEDSALLLQIKDNELTCVGWGTPAQSVLCRVKVNELKRVEIFYDRGILEVFVNDGESAGSMLLDDRQVAGSIRIETIPENAEIRVFGLEGKESALN
ncbi:MAG: glycoside hydrolase family 32 protein [Bifidobacterium sp.]|jgi:beta-fructofuranosidase